MELILDRRLAERRIFPAIDETFRDKERREASQQRRAGFGLELKKTFHSSNSVDLTEMLIDAMENYN